MGAEFGNKVEVSASLSTDIEVVTYTEIALFQPTPVIQQDIINNYGINPQALTTYIQSNSIEREKLLSKNRRLSDALTKIVLEKKALQVDLKESQRETTAAKRALKKSKNTAEQAKANAERENKRIYNAAIRERTKAAKEKARLENAMTSLIASTTAALTAHEVAKQKEIAASVAKANAAIAAADAKIIAYEEAAADARKPVIGENANGNVRILRKEKFTLKQALTQEGITLPVEVRDDEYIKGQLISSGGSISADGLLTFPNGMLHKGKVLKIEQYINITEELNNPEATLKSKITNFESLLQNFNEFILGKEVLALDYMKNISNDLTKKGEYISKNEAGEYVILDLDGGDKSAETENAELLKVCNENVATKYLNFAITYDIVEGLGAVLDNETNTQKSTINKLLSKYAKGIVGDDNIENILAPGTLAALEAHLTKLDATAQKKDIQKTKEIAYLISIVNRTKGSAEGGEDGEKAKNPLDSLTGMFEENEAAFRDVKTFKAYQNVKGLIDGGDFTNEKTKTALEENLGDIISGTAGSLLLPGALISIILLFGGYKKGAGAIMIALIGGMAAGKIISKTENKGITKNPNAITIKPAYEFGPKPENVSDKPGVQSLYSALEKANIQNHEAKETDPTVSTVSDNYVLGGIVKKITGTEELKKANQITIEDLEKGELTKVYTLILGTSAGVVELSALGIDGLPKGYTGKVNQTEIKNFIKLLLTQVDEDDETLADLLEKDTYIVNRSYESMNMPFMSNDGIKDMLNDSLSKAHEKASKAGDATLLEKYGKLKSKTINALQLSFTDDQNVDKIKDLIKHVNKKFGKTDLFAIEYTKILELYKIYIEQNKELKEYDGFYDTRKNSAAALLGKAIGVVSTAKEVQLIGGIQQDIITENNKLINLKKSINNSLISGSFTIKQQKIFEKTLNRIDELILQNEILFADLDRAVDGKIDPELLKIIDKTKAENLLKTKNPDKALGLIVGNAEVLKKLEKSTPDIFDIEENMKNYAILLENQSMFKQAFTDLQAATPRLVIVGNYSLEKIKTVLDGFTPNKVIMQGIFEKPVDDFYAENETQKTDVDKINPALYQAATSGTPAIAAKPASGSKIADDIKALKKLEEHLSKNGVGLDTNSKNGMKALVLQLQTEHAEIQARINAASNTAPVAPGTPTVPNIDLAEEAVIKYNEAIALISKFADGTEKWTKASIKTISDKVHDVNMQRKAANIDNLKQFLVLKYNAAKESLTFTAHNASLTIQNSNRDEVVQNAIIEGEKTFPGFGGTGTKTSLEDLKTLLGDKREEVRAKIENKINTISTATFTGMPAIDLKAAYKNLEGYKTNDDYEKIIGDSLDTKIESIQGRIEAEYILLPLSENNSLLEAIKEHSDNISSFENFLKSNYSDNSGGYSSVLLSNEKIRTFIEKVAQSQLTEKTEIVNAMIIVLRKGLKK